jgi:circadian clock protein KaiB
VKTNESSETTKKFEVLAAQAKNTLYVLRLYIAGNSPRSAQAVANIREICESRLKGRYQLEVIDIYQQAALAKGEQIIAVPTLIKSLPHPLKRIIGDLSKTEKVIFGLDILESDDNDPPDRDPVE